MTHDDKSPKNSKNSRRAWLLIPAVLVIIVVAILIWWYGDQKAPELAQSSLKSPDAGLSDSEDLEQSVSILDPDNRREDQYTILVVGYDKGKANTDTMMVARFDSKENKLSIVSIPRDTLVNVSWGDKKINSIYRQSGNDIEALINGIKDILGFRVDSYALVDIAAFEKIVDSIGGIYYDVPQDMHYSDPEQDLAIDIDKGYQWLNGENAVKVCRFRYGYPMADIDRIGVQQDFLKSAIPQILSLGNALKAPELINIILDSLQTNLSFGNIKWYLTQLLSTKPEDINFMMLPANPCCLINGGSYVSIYADDWLNMVNTYLSPYESEIRPENCNILYQIAAEPDKYVITPANYVVTNGSELAGGFNSFYKYKQ